MSDVVACRGCKKFFNYLPRGLCAECLEARDVVFRQVRDFVYANPGSTISEVSDATGVDMRTVRELIRDGELQWTPADALDGADAGITCELCGTAISDGRHCAPCRQRLLGGLQPSDDALPADDRRQRSGSAQESPAGGSTTPRMWRRT